MKIDLDELDRNGLTYGLDGAYELAALVRIARAAVAWRDASVEEFGAVDEALQAALREAGL